MEQTQVLGHSTICMYRTLWLKNFVEDFLYSNSETLHHWHTSLRTYLSVDYNLPYFWCSLESVTRSSAWKVGSFCFVSLIWFPYDSVFEVALSRKCFCLCRYSNVCVLGPFKSTTYLRVTWYNLYDLGNCAPGEHMELTGNWHQRPS